MPNYLLLLHEKPAQYAALSPDDMQAIVEEYMAWSQRLGAEGKLVGGDKLRDEGGRHLRRTAGGVTVTDGPYAEAKEVIGGTFVVTAPDYDAAVAIARDCPHMKNGWIELREIEELG